MPGWAWGLTGGCLGMRVWGLAAVWLGLGLAGAWLGLGSVWVWMGVNVGSVWVWWSWCPLTRPACGRHGRALPCSVDRRDLDPIFGGCQQVGERHMVPGSWDRDLGGGTQSPKHPHPRPSLLSFVCVLPRKYCPPPQTGWALSLSRRPGPGGPRGASLLRQDPPTSPVLSLRPACR